MPRKPRIEFPGAFYHVISRGNNRQAVFLNDADYEKFIECLNITKERFPFKLYAYTQMPNHFHLLLETIQTPLSVIMRSVLTRYASYFNKKHGRIGHVFQSRYKAILCQKDSYLLELVRYIHLNPVRAKIVESPADWKWSSHQEYIGTGKNKSLMLEIREVLGYFSVDIFSARKKYCEFVNDRIQTHQRDSFKETYPTETFPYLGDENFVDNMSKKYGELRRRSELELRIKPDELLKKVSIVSGVSEDDIRGPDKGAEISLIRGIFSHIAYYYAGYKIKDIAKILRRSSSAVTLHLRNLKIQIESDKNIKRIVNEILTT